MTRILFVGQKTETVDFSDPAIPPGFDAAKINAGIEIAVAAITERGWKADLCMIPPDERAGPMLEEQLASARYDCVVLGAGPRLPPQRLDRKSVGKAKSVTVRGALRGSRVIKKK